MIQPQDLTRPPVTLDHDSTLVVVIDMSQASWLVAAIVPGVERRPLQKLKPDHEALLRLLARWRDEAAKAGKPLSPTKLAATASGWPAGCSIAASRRMSFTPTASPSHGRAAALRPIGSIRRC